MLLGAGRCKPHPPPFFPSLPWQKPPPVLSSTMVQPVAWYIPASVALGGTLLLAAGLCFAWYRLGPQLLAMRAEAAKKRASIVDQVALFNRNHLDMFFAQKRATRVVQQRQIMRNTWRYR